MQISTASGFTLVQSPDVGDPTVLVVEHDHPPDLLGLGLDGRTFARPACPSPFPIGSPRP
jgi:hypothetical protein